MQTKIYQAGSRTRKSSCSRAAVISKQRVRELLAKAAAPTVKTSQRKRVTLEAIRRRAPGSSTSTQVARMLTAMQRLKAGGINTIEARLHLGVPHPAGRIKQLRDADHQVLTSWVVVIDEAGESHRVAAYSLVDHGSVGMQ